MGYLEKILAAVDNTKRVAKRNISDLVSDPAAYAERMTDALRNSNRGVVPTASPTELTNRPMTQQERVDQMASQMDFGGGLGKIVWHGSPHKFNKFDMSKIGTGEGAQAYGHGLYMAETPDVAKSYVGGNTGYVKEPLISGKTVDQLPKELLRKWEMDTGGSSYALFDQLRMSNDPAKTIAFYKKEGGNLGKVVEEIDKMGVSLKDAGNLYKSDIPDEAIAKFLDWDKPLSEQAPEVVAAIGKMRDKFPLSKGGWDIKPWMDSDPLASTWHNEAIRELGVGQDFFTKNLSENGVPGIRYLDGSSRSAGEGTSNFVLFDDQLPRILERNGEATGLQPWKPGEWQSDSMANVPDIIEALRNKK